MLRGELARAFDPSLIDGYNRLELRTTAWQVPLRLHTQLFRLGRKAALGLRNGLILQLQSQGQPRISGDYEAGSYVDEYNSMLITRRGSADPSSQLYPARSRKAGALLLETGAEFSYALTPALTLDLSTTYQAGLRQVEAPGLYYLNEYRQGQQRALTASTKGSNLLVGLTARYALRTWGAASGG